VNDDKYTIALNDNGTPSVFADKHGRQGCSGLRKDIIAEIIRDEKARETIYNISFPWTEFGISKQFSPSFQVLIMVNNTTENEKNRQIAVFGKSKFGLGSNFKSWYFHRFNTELPSSSFAEIVPTKTSVYNNNDSAEMIVGLSAGKDYTFNIYVDKKKVSKKVSL